jgi:hypothetical protein
MGRAYLLAILALCLVFRGPAAAAGEPRTPEALEKEIQKETNARKRANLARDLLTQRLELLRKRIATGTMLEESSPELGSYEAALGMFGSAVKEAAHSGTSKSAEQFLRDQIHELDNFKMNVSVTERPYLERIVARAGALRGELLDSLMHPPGGAKSSSKEASQRQEPVPK